MADKPLKILTLDGGGLQAIGTLLILDKLLTIVAEQNSAPVKPRPCDVFDTIGGIGAGGWLAILLGRFHMDISACFAEWYNLLQCIKPRTRGEALRRRLIHHSYFDSNTLVDQVKHLTKLYGTGPSMVDSKESNVRCKYVFVAALDARSASSRDSSPRYNLFRTYPKGPSDPSGSDIAAAFAATGAAKYFSQPWKEQIGGDGEVSFFDHRFPKPHNITKLALEEMWAIFDGRVPISIIINIGPGLPKRSDFRKIAKRFSFGRDGKSSPRSIASISSSLFEPSPKNPASTPGMQKPLPPEAPEAAEMPSTGESEKLQHQSGISGGRLPPSTKGSNKANSNYKSIMAKIWERTLRKEEKMIEDEITELLKSHYPDGSPPYYRLAPQNSPKGAAQNDTSAVITTVDAYQGYLNESEVVRKIDEAIPRILE
jgi:hypothetical protein